jgi:transcriptional regulator with XRE-family HTH domain
LRVSGVNGDSAVHAPPNLRPYQIRDLAILACSESAKVNELAVGEADFYAVDALGVAGHLLARLLILLFKVIAQPLNLARAGIFDDSPHKTIEISAIDPGRAANRSPVTGSEPLYDLMGVHVAQYTYPSFESKTHMYTGGADNGGMGEIEARQILARNIASRMDRDHNLDTQPKLSAKSHVAQPHISRILRGTSGATIDAIAKIARAFNCQPWELLVDSEQTRRAALERMLVRGSPGEPANDLLPVYEISSGMKRIAARKRKRRP